MSAVIVMIYNILIFILQDTTKSTWVSFHLYSDLYDVFDLQLRFHIITTISVSVTITLLTNKCTTFTSSVSSVSYYYSLVSLYAYSVSSSLQDQS